MVCLELIWYAFYCTISFGISLVAVFLCTRRRHFEQIKTAIPVVLNVLESASPEEENEVYLHSLFQRGIIIASSIQEVCGKLVRDMLHDGLSFFLLSVLLLLLSNRFFGSNLNVKLLFGPYCRWKMTNGNLVHCLVLTSYNSWSLSLLSSSYPCDFLEYSLLFDFFPFFCILILLAHLWSFGVNASIMQAYVSKVFRATSSGSTYICQLSRFLPFCGFSYPNLVTGDDIDAVSIRLGGGNSSITPVTIYTVWSFGKF